MKEWVFKVGVVLVGMVMVFVSIARASFEVIAKEVGEDAIKNRYLEFVITSEDGKTLPANYNLPEAGMLPSNPFYGFKKIRDWMWMNFATGANKAKVAVLMADKKITEVSELFRLGDTDLAIETGNEVLDKLEYANGLLEATDIQLRRQLFLAGYAFKEIASNGSESFDMDQQKFKELINRIDRWNEKQEEERYLWDK